MTMNDMAGVFLLLVLFSTPLNIAASSIFACKWINRTSCGTSMQPNITNHRARRVNMDRDKSKQISSLPVFSSDILHGIGVCGQMHGVVLWKKASTVEKCDKQQTEITSIFERASLHQPSNLYTWQDQRCTPAFLENMPKPSNEKLPVSTGHGCATLFWLHQSDEQTSKMEPYDFCGTIMDFFLYLLCGLEHPLTSDQLAASFGYFNQETGEWDSVLQDCPKFPHHLLPFVTLSGTRLGVVQPCFSAWPDGAPVLVSMGDVQCSMGAILKNPGRAAINISTSVQLGFLVQSEDVEQAEKPWPPSISFFPFFGRCHLALCAGLNGGNAIHHFVACVANWMKDLGFAEDMCTIPNVFSKLLNLSDENKKQKEPAAETTPKLNVRPTFYGERHDPTLTAEISGISLTNFQDMGHLFRCVCEGIIHHLSTMIPPDFLLDQGIKELLVCGSVPVKNNHIKNALKDVYSKKDLLIDFDTVHVSSALGAAQIAKNILQV